MVSCKHLLCKAYSFFLKSPWSRNYCCIGYNWRQNNEIELVANWQHAWSQCKKDKSQGRSKVTIKPVMLETGAKSASECATSPNQKCWIRVTGCKLALLACATQKRESELVLLNLAASANRSRSSRKLSSWPRALENSLGCWKPAPPPLLLPAP